MCKDIFWQLQIKVRKILQASSLVCIYRRFHWSDRQSQWRVKTILSKDKQQQIISQIDLSTHLRIIQIFIMQFLYHHFRMPLRLKYQSLPKHLNQKIGRMCWLWKVRYRVHQNFSYFLLRLSVLRTPSIFVLLARQVSNLRYKVGFEVIISLYKFLYA